MTAPSGSERGTSSKTPALVVSGFLGSGKTSLVLNLLESALEEGIRVAVVSNELGELGIDRALLGRGGDAFVELEGGCVCCELSDDLLDTLQTLRDRVNPDRIVIETSGVALPFDTTLNFWREPISAWVGEDTAVVVVNAEQLAERRDLEGTFEDQVSSADLLLLNKVDLVPESSLEGLEETLRELEPEAPIVRCTRGRVPVNLLFPPDPQTPDRTRPPPQASEHYHEQFATREWQVPEGITPEELVRKLRRPGLLRAKGWAITTEGVKLVQVVGHRVELSQDEPCDGAPIGRIVLIERAGS